LLYYNNRGFGVKFHMEGNERIKSKNLFFLQFPEMELLLTYTSACR
jgi:hypothetical protein